jgi:hypothetical protein
MGNNMTALRRRRKLVHVTILGLVAAAALAGPFVRRTSAATSELVVVDRHTGLAISGYDPVAYFTDGAARPGMAFVEASFAGTVWRFRSTGNRAAFLNDPDIYAPRFGGYDPLALARGVAVPGDPRLWLLSGGRLYFFYGPENKAKFSADAEQGAAEAERRWPAVQLTLAP